MTHIVGMLGQYMSWNELLDIPRCCETLSAHSIMRSPVHTYPLRRLLPLGRAMQYTRTVGGGESQLIALSSKAKQGCLKVFLIRV